MKYLSLFSGIGGFELGIQQAYELSKMGAESENSTDSTSESSQYGQRPLCIGYSEIDKYACQIYQRHFPGHKNYGDITTIDARGLPNFDLLVGGFPCQSFSVAGKRGGFGDTRGTLFFEIARLLKEKQPRLLLLENVKGLLSHDNGGTFYTIIQTLDELGYDLQWQVLNSKDFGVPQNRERVFIVGHLRGTSRPEVFPFGGGGQSNGNERILAHTLNASDWRGANRNQQQTTIRQNLQTRGDITDPQCESGREAYSIRRLTPTECERLQGFPDGWTEGISDTQRYKCLGNAVTVNVIKAIITQLRDV